MTTTAEDFLNETRTAESFLNAKDALDFLGEPQDIPLTNAEPASAPNRRFSGLFSPESQAEADRLTGMRPAMTELQLSEDRKTAERREQSSFFDSTKAYLASAGLNIASAMTDKETGVVANPSNADDVREHKNLRDQRTLLLSQEPGYVERDEQDEFDRALAGINYRLNELEGDPSKLSRELRQAGQYAWEHYNASPEAKNPAAQIGRGAGMVTSLVPSMLTGAPGIPLGIGQAAMQAKGEAGGATEAQLRASGVTDPIEIKAIADRAASEAAAYTIPASAVFLLGGKVAASAASKLAGDAASPLVKAAYGTAGAGAANVTGGSLIRAAEGQDWKPTLENLTADTLFALFHGVGEYSKASPLARERAGEVLKMKEAAVKNVQEVMTGPGEEISANAISHLTPLPDRIAMRVAVGDISVEQGTLEAAYQKAGSGLEGVRESTPTGPAESTPEAPRRTIESLQAELPKEPQPIGITPGKKTVDIPVRLAATDPAIERRWQAARGLTTQGFFSKLKEKVATVGKSFTRADPLLEPKTDGEIIDAVRMIRASPEIARGQAVQFLQGITQPLGKNGHDLFSRIIILKDMVKDIDRGLYAGKSDLPFGYKDKTQVVDDLARFEVEAAKPDLASVNVREALESRQKIMTTLRDEMVNRDLLPEQVKDFDDYFHRQVLEYYNELDAIRTGGQPDARVRKKGFQKRRVGGTKDYNTSYLESEYEVMSQMMQQIRVHDELQRVKAASDIRPRLESMAATARASGDPEAKWQDFIPDDYKTWQPERGRYFYPAKTIAEKTLNDFLAGTKELTADDFRNALAMGQEKPQWVLPDRVANTLDNLNRQPESNIAGELAEATTGAWKKYQLFNPKRLLKYIINNQSGDLDIVLSYRPEILSELPAAEREMWAVARGGKTSPIIQEARAHGVLDAGWTAAEIPDVHQHAALARLEPGNRGKLRKMWDAYWGTATNLARWREGVLRLASYQWVKKQMAAGKFNTYGPTRRTELDAVQGLENKAAKVARELIGDYGNISQAGRWLRTRMMPFWSWMEINAPRYYRLFKNLPYEAEGGSYTRIARGAAASAARAILTPTKMLAMYGLIKLFNNSTEERRKMAQEIGDNKGQLHLVLGRDEEGKVQSLRFQGALSDALSWAGLDDAPEDIAKLASGDRTIGEQAQDMALAAPEKIINAALPIQKTAVETAGGFSLYPDPFKPRPLRDRWQHLARGLSLGEVYDAATGIPNKQNMVRSAVLYSTDPQEQAFFATRRLVNDFEEKHGGERKPFGFTDKQNALHYFKLASQQKNEKLAKKWWDTYVRLGGKYENAMQSIDSLSPTSGLTIAQKAEFMASLKGEKKKMVEEAEKWSASAKAASKEMINKVK